MTTPLTLDAVQPGELYTREQVASLLKRTTTTLSRKKWRERITPVAMSGHRVMYPGERIILYFAELGWEKPASRRPESPAQTKRRVQAATARSLAAV